MSYKFDPLTSPAERLGDDRMARLFDLAGEGEHAEAGDADFTRSVHGLRRLDRIQAFIESVVEQFREKTWVRTHFVVVPSLQGALGFGPAEMSPVQAPYFGRPVTTKWGAVTEKQDWVTFGPGKAQSARILLMPPFQNIHLLDQNLLTCKLPGLQSDPLGEYVSYIGGVLREAQDYILLPELPLRWPSLESESYQTSLATVAASFEEPRSDELESLRDLRLRVRRLSSVIRRAQRAIPGLVKAFLAHGESDSAAEWINGFRRVGIVVYRQAGVSKTMVGWYAIETISRGHPPQINRHAETEGESVSEALLKWLMAGGPFPLP